MSKSISEGGSSVDTRTPLQKDIDHIDMMVNYHKVRLDIETAAMEPEKAGYHRHQLKLWEDKQNKPAEVNSSANINPSGCFSFFVGVFIFLILLGIAIIFA